MVVKVEQAGKITIRKGESPDTRAEESECQIGVCNVKRCAGERVALKEK
jgi:hypothetical protein